MIFIIDSTRPHTGQIEFPISNQTGYFFTLGMDRNNENRLTLIDAHISSANFTSKLGKSAEI